MGDEGKIKEQSIGREKTWNGLRKSEMTYRAAVEGSFDAIIMLDTQRNIVLCNEAFLSLFGYEKGEAEGQSIRIIHTSEESFDNLGRIAYPVIMKKNVFRTELDLVRKDGTLLPVEISVSAIKDIDGPIAGYVTVLRDITERKQSEEALYKSEQKYRSIFDNAVEGIFQTTPEGRYLSVNPSFARMFGFASPGEMIKSITDIGHQLYVNPEDRERLKHRLTEHGVVEGLLALVYRKDGSTFWISINAHAVRDSDGTILYYEGTNEDITEQKYAEEALRKSETRYRQMFDYNPLPAIVFDVNTLTVVDVNAAAVIHYGYTNEEFSAMTIKDLHLSGEVPALLSYICGPRLGTKNTWRHVKKDGTVIDVEISEHALEFPGNECRIAIINDITDRKKTEEELKRSYEQLRVLSSHLQRVREEERKEVARELHDTLGQILTTLNMDIAWTKTHLPVEEKLLFRKAGSMSVLVKQAIKEVQRVSAELRPVILDDFGLGPALEWTAETFKKQTGIDVHAEVESGIDPDSERSTAIYRIVRESLSNVARHASATQLIIRLKREDNSLIVEIQDNGKGLSDKERDDPKSFGILGMRERAAIIGGELAINGIRGQGTTVRVEIPVLLKERRNNDQNPDCR